MDINRDTRILYASFSCISLLCVTLSVYHFFGKNKSVNLYNSLIVIILIIYSIVNYYMEWQLGLIYLFALYIVSFVFLYVVRAVRVET